MVYSTIFIYDLYQTTNISTLLDHLLTEHTNPEGSFQIKFIDKAITYRHIHEDTQTKTEIEN